MARVFVSYASADIVLAREVCRWLEADRHEVFLAQDLREGIAAGDQWRSRLHERLRWADAVVCVVTSAAVASPWCSHEVSSALSRGSRLIPVLAEPGVTHPLLTDLQHVDLTRNSATAPAAIAEALRRVDAAGGFGWEDDRSPFPGLRPFDIEQHRVFFGRVSETGELAELLRSPAEQAKAARSAISASVPVSELISRPTLTRPGLPREPKVSLWGSVSMPITAGPARPGAGGGQRGRGPSPVRDRTLTCWHLPRAIP